MGVATLSRVTCVVSSKQLGAVGFFCCDCSGLRPPEAVVEVNAEAPCCALFAYGLSGVEHTFPSQVLGALGMGPHVAGCLTVCPGHRTLPTAAHSPTATKAGCTLALLLLQGRGSKAAPGPLVLHARPCGDSDLCVYMV